MVICSTVQGICYVVVVYVKCQHCAEVIKPTDSSNYWNVNCFSTYLHSDPICDLKLLFVWEG